jgi:hypothetical protein
VFLSKSAEEIENRKLRLDTENERVRKSLETKKSIFARCAKSAERIENTDAWFMPEGRMLKL